MNIMLIMRRGNLKKKIVILVICVLLIVIGIICLVIKNSNTFTNKLKHLGYSDLEASKIADTVNISNQDIILSFGKNSVIVDLVSSKDYVDKNLEDYLEYYNKNKKAPTSDIIEIVNSGYDILDKPYSVEIASMIKEKYFIFDNLDRYLTYYENNQDMNISDVIAYVNANVDKERYVDTKKTDTKDKYLVLVNKYYYLTEDYEPSDLVKLTSQYNLGTNNRMRRDAANAFMKMADAALLDNVTIKNASAYRDYKYQVTLYNNYVLRDGKEAADTYSARPGFSEHQTGLVTDINLVDDAFEDTDAFRWLIDNAYKYGFILRFPKNKEDITGYKYEPWHYRYVGKEAAKVMVKENLTLEEYYAYYVETKKED